MKSLAAAVMAVLACLVIAFVPEVQARTVGSGQSAREARPAADIDSVEQHGNIDVVIRQAAQPAIEVEADANLLPLLETVVEGRKLVVRWKRGENISTRKPAIVRVDVLQLQRASSAGSGDVQLLGLKAAALKLDLTGSADAKIDGLAADSLEIGISGSGTVAGSGRAKTLSLRISGSGDATLHDLAADDVTVRIAGSGDASVNAAQSLEVKIAGSGDVRYVGTPPKLKTTVAGSGSVKRQ